MLRNTKQFSRALQYFNFLQKEPYGDCYWNGQEVVSVREERIRRNIVGDNNLKVNSCGIPVSDKIVNRFY